MKNSMVTTTFTLPGHKIIRNAGIVRGITVRSRSIIGNFFGGLQTIFGGNITIYESLCERARLEAYEGMCTHAEHLGANAIVGMSYESNEVMAGVTEVLCYGTAVIVEAI